MDYKDSPKPLRRATSPASAYASDGEGRLDRKRQRVRPVLACTACKRRKIKCDRNLPCESCIKRGEPDGCQWDPQIEPERSKYALSEEVERLQQRLEIMEKTLRSGRNTIEVCCPASCSCHDEPKTRSRGAPVAAGEDLPLSQLIDEKLGFKRDLEPAVTGGLPIELASASGTECGIPASKLISSSRLSSVSLKPQECSEKNTASRLPIFAHFGNDTFLSIFAAILPRRQACDALLQAYFQDFDWSCHVLHGPSFHREYETFWTLYERQQVSGADPAWLALFMIILALGVRCLSEAELPGDIQNYDPVEVEQWPELFFECSQLALKQAHWTRKPQVRVLQTILLFLPYLDFTSEGPDTLIWIGAASKIAHASLPFHLYRLHIIMFHWQLLGLHRLANDDSGMPADDLALPTGSSVMKRQLAYRLWLCLLSADMMASATGRQPLSTSPSRTDTLKYLLNCNDIDLQVGSKVILFDSHNITDVTFELVKFRLAVHQHEYLEASVEAGGSLSPFELARLDRNLRIVIDGIAEPAVPPGGAPFSNSVSLLMRRYNMIGSAVHYRLLRLHRPYMERGYVDSVYQSSTSACVESALFILRSNSNFRAASTISNWFFTLHCIEAVLVIFVDIFWKMDHNAPKEALERNKRDLPNVAYTFGAAAASFSPQVQQLARLGKSLLPKLLEEASARNMVPIPHREAISEVFKRTAFTLCASSQSPPSDLQIAPANSVSAADPWTSLLPTDQLPVNTSGGITDFQMLTDVFGDFDFDFNFAPDSQTYMTYPFHLPADETL